MKKIIFAGILHFLCNFSIAQYDSTKSAPIFSFTADAYYRYDLNNPSGKTNNLTSFTNSNNSFELGMASVKAEHSIGKVSGTLDLGFGRRANEFSYNDANSLASVKQLFLTYAPNSKIKFTMGKWATHIGYEMVDAQLNRNYSMSYGFSYGPFFHTGIKADIGLGGNTNFMIGVANPTDFSTTASSTKVLIAQLSTATKSNHLKAYLNYQGGSGLNQLDLIFNANLSKQFNLAYNFSHRSDQTNTGTKKWTSNALYANYDPLDAFGITLRTEYFNDKENLAGLNAGIFQTTISGNIRINNLTLIPEIRWEKSNNPIFEKSTGQTSLSTTSFIIAAVYHF